MRALRRHRVLLVFLLFVLTGMGVALFAVSGQAEQPWLTPNVEDAEAPAEIENKLETKLKNPLRFHPEDPSHETAEARELREHLFYAVFTPANEMWATVPVQAETVFKRFRHHAVYSDTGATIGKLFVTDAVALLDTSVVKTSEALHMYQLRRYGNDHNLGLGPAAYPEDAITDLFALVQPELLKDIVARAPTHAQWFVLADSKSYLNGRALERWLQGADPAKPVVYKWGPNILWSRGAEELVLSTNYAHVEQEVASGNLSSTAITKSNWCSPLPFFHDLKPWEVQTLHDWELSAAGSETYNDFYRDFLLPFVKLERQNWELAPAGARYTDNYSESLQPHTQKRHCKRLCDMDPACLAWQWRDGRECWLEANDTIRRGAAMNPEFAAYSKAAGRVTTGYIVERIRGMRSELECDPLTISPRPQNTPSDSELTSEGWLHRLKDRITIDKSEVLQAMYAYDEELAET